MSTGNSYGGAGSQVYACIAHYMREYNPGLYELYDNLCLLDLLNVRNEGLTFLMPDDKLTKKLQELLKGSKDYKESQANVRDLIMQLKAFCVIGYCRSPAELNGKVNKLIQPVSVASGKLDSGHEVKEAKEFVIVDMPEITTGKGEKVKPRASLQQVFNLSGGDLLNTKKERSKMPAKIKGGHNLQLNDVYHYAIEVEDMWLENYLKMKASKQSIYADSYLEAVLSYMSFLKKEDDASYKAHLCCMDIIPLVSFYLIFKPFSGSSPIHYDKWFAATRGRFICFGAPQDCYKAILADAQQHVPSKASASKNITGQTLMDFVEKLGAEEANIIYARYRLYHLLNDICDESRLDDIVDAFNQLRGSVRSALCMKNMQAIPGLLNVPKMLQEGQKQQIVTVLDQMVLSDLPDILKQELSNIQSCAFPDFSQAPGSGIVRYAGFAKALLENSSIEICGPAAQYLMQLCNKPQ